jgi:hypothetical protein
MAGAIGAVVDTMEDTIMVADIVMAGAITVIIMEVGIMVTIMEVIITITMVGVVEVGIIMAGAWVA